VVADAVARGRIERRGHRDDESDQRGFLLSAFGSPDPLHDSRTKGSVNVVATPEPELSAETKELHAMATYEAWAAATRVAFQTRSEKKTKKRTEPKNGDEEDEASLCGNAHGASSTVTDALLAMASVHLTKKHREPAPVGQRSRFGFRVGSSRGGCGLRSSGERKQNLRVRRYALRRIASRRVVRSRFTKKLRRGRRHAQRPSHGVDRGLRFRTQSAVRRRAVLRVSRPVSQTPRLFWRRRRPRF
jgi:hypothetical protein